MKAVIMAGGKGTRLKPLTCAKPKPMVPIVNRPMMEHIINLLKKHHFSEVLATLYYLPEAIRNYFGDGHDFGLRMRYFTEETPLGTAGSVRNCAEFLDETFLVISGDALTDIDLEAAVRFHQEKKATATLILTKVDNPLEYGVVITGEDGRIKRFLEKPGWGEVFSDTVNTGIYILDPKVFAFYQPGQNFDFSKDLFPLLLSGGEPLYGYVAGGYWSDIGNLEQYRQAHYDLLTGRIKLEIPGREIKPGVWAGEGVEIAEDAIIEGPVLLGNFTRVMSKAEIKEYTVIGDHCNVLDRGSIKRGIIWNHCYLGTDTEIRGAVIGDHSRLKGKNAVFEGVVLGEGVTVGVRSVIKPQVKIWPYKNIDSGIVVNDSMIWAKKGPKSLFGYAGISGTVNQEITPEIAVKLGAVFGAYLKPREKMAVSSDNFRAARVLKRALVAGALGAGVDVYDLGTLTIPVVRFAIHTLGVKGGVHLQINPREAEGILIQFFDHTGVNIDKNTERALENSFFCEDYPRAAADAMGELTFVPQLIEPYIQGLLDPEVKELIGNKEFKIVADYDGGSLSLILPGLLEQLNCRVIGMDYPENVTRARPRTLKELGGALSTVAAKINSAGADLGVVVDNNAERLILLDEKGELLKEEQLTALLSFLTLKYKHQATVALQVTAPRFIEDLAREFHGRVIRTKANPRSIMEKVIQERLFPSADGNNILQPDFDALYTLLKVLELLARENISLSEAKALVPRVERGYLEVECPWEEKGRIMRNLFEENKERQLEMTDGLKVFHEQGWALVLPDAEEPVFKVYAEAGTAEEADALTRLYMTRISELQLH
ncbi:MAG: sugar phosphate nucleotidyltransferase [Bacillota bacterium]